MVCLDTSFIADLNRKDTAAVETLEAFIDKEEPLMTTIINVAELYKGAYGHHLQAKKVEEVDALTEILYILEMNVKAAKHYGYYYQHLKRKGAMIDDRDILIASIALSFGENRIVTRNVRYFEKIEPVSMMSY